MKKLNKRTQIILAIVGVLVVVGIGVMVFSQATGEDLFGTVIDIKISPSSSTIIVGQSATLSSGTALSNCSWSSSNTSVAAITSSSTKSATVLAKAAGTATITEKCGLLGRYKGSATVTVNPAPTPTPTPMPTATPSPAPTITASSCDLTLFAFNQITLSTGDASTLWSISSPSTANVTLSATSGASVIVQSGAAGFGTVVVSAHTPGSATASITLTKYGNYNGAESASVGVGKTTTVTSGGWIESLSIPSTCPSNITLTPNSGIPGFSFKGLSAGKTVVWSKQTSGVVFVYAITVTP